MPQEPTQIAKQLLKKYRFLSLLSLLFLVPYAVTAWMDNVPLALDLLSPLGIALCFLFSYLATRWLTKCIRNKLMQDLDLATYSGCIDTLKWSRFSPTDIVLSAYAAGDHQRVINATQSALLATKIKHLRYVWLSWLSASQFILGDRAQLARTLFEMEMLAKKKPPRRALCKKTRHPSLFPPFSERQFGRVRARLP